MKKLIITILIIIGLYLLADKTNSGYCYDGYDYMIEKGIKPYCTKATRFSWYLSRLEFSLSVTTSIKDK